MYPAKTFQANYRLRQERIQRNWRQRDLAEQLGTTELTIQRWEKGSHQPSTYFRVKLCMLFGKSAEELGLLPPFMPHISQAVAGHADLSLETSAAPSPDAVRLWNIPYPRNPCFTGREPLLQRLRAWMASAQSVSLSQAIALSGLGGVGKTQVAIEYAYRYALEYSAVFWLATETPESLMVSLQQIADLLHLPARHAVEQPQMIAAVQRWLANHSGWLLIGDNVENLDLLLAVLPSSWQGTILLTTRCQALGTFAEPLELTTMSSEEGVTLVLRRARRLGEPLQGAGRQRETLLDTSESRAAVSLVALLDGLPLALDQAGAYIEETGCSVANYLQRCYDQRKQVLARRGDYGGTHPASVSTTVRLAVERIEQEHPAAAGLLRVCALVHPEDIPEELFLGEPPHRVPGLDIVIADPYQFDLALAALRHASLVTRHPVKRTLSLHRLVQAVLQDHMEPAEWCLWSQRVARLLLRAWPGEEVNTWLQCERLLPHVLACTAVIEDAACDQELIELFHKAGDYLAQRARFKPAEALFRRALRVEVQALGPNHPRAAASLARLAYLLGEQGNFQEAETVFHHALAIREQTLGSTHPEVARLLTGLAAIATAQGKNEQAEPLYLRALQIWEQGEESEPLELARVLYGQAGLRKNQGQYEQAERLYERALHLREQVLGSTHPKVAMTLSNLATISQATRNFEQAESLYLRALSIWEQTVGLTHPDVAYALNNLGEVYRGQQRYEQAQVFSRRALHLWKEALGPEHVLVAYPLHNQARIAQAQGKLARAEALFKRALQIRERQLESIHPTIAHTLNCLATLYRDQGKYAQAIPFYQRALALIEQRLGPTHHYAMEIFRAYQEVVKQEQATLGASKWGQCVSGNANLKTRQAISAAPFEADADQMAEQFRQFLDACCDLQPGARSRSSDLWQAYERWAEHQQISLMLSRRAFANHLKAYGCQAGRTNTVRLWHGIATLKKAP